MDGKGVMKKPRTGSLSGALLKLALRGREVTAHQQQG